VALVVSGGHTNLFRVTGPGQYELLGQTIDDAAGEAFDKGANLLGLGYPGGPAIDKAAEGGNVDYVRFPRGRQRPGKSRFGGLDPDLCFSFSGLKTALLYYLEKRDPIAGEAELASIAASYQEAIVDAVVTRCGRAVGEEKCLAVGGGVSLNRRLRGRISELAVERGITLRLAEPRYCADNAAMIAGLAGMGQGIWAAEAMAADVDPNLTLGWPD
jgi:N6-L-threonylcarbamoyladenine synthase